MFEMNNLDDSLFSKINKKEDFLEDIIKKRKQKIIRCGIVKSVLLLVIIG